ncbi:MAG TPA: helix-turn-helix transcriptional regulator [Candidatus Acidoferrales bacterium]|nr:helix-turn-helix transcriptional regulator [Candidatus Acidoferrales bacterium]
MRRRPRYPASDGFIRLVREGMERRGVSLNELARLAKISPASLSRILNRERGLPSDRVIQRLSELLDLKPRDVLLVEARRIPEDLQLVLNNTQVRVLLRASGKLNEIEMQRVIQVAQDLVRRNQRKRNRP